MGRSHVWCDHNWAILSIDACIHSNSETHHETFFADLEHLVPVTTEPCPELRLIEDRKSMFGTMREAISRDSLIVDERESMNVVLETLYFYQGEQNPF